MAMTDEWSRCPICFEDYSLQHRPTTFVCGHSTCIDHTIGGNRLTHCPICRHQLRDGSEHHVSYNLEEASRLFQLIKHKIDWSTIQLPSEANGNQAQNSTEEMTHRDEIYARQLQAELDRERTNNSSHRAQRQTASAAVPTQTVNRPNGHPKNCGHQCDLITTRQCCTCADRRPNIPGHGYERYVDGRGACSDAARNEFYCSTCKRR